MSAVEEDHLNHPFRRIQHSSPRRQVQASSGTRMPSSEHQANVPNPLSLTTAFHHPEDSRLQVFTPDVYGLDVSPADPHDFYRAHDPFTTDVIVSSDRPRFTAGTLDAMRIPPRKSGSTNARENIPVFGAPHPTWDRKSHDPASKSPSIKSKFSTPSGPNRPAVTMSGAPRLPQGSLQHLVDRFNQKNDETLPLPFLRAGVAAARSGSPASKASKVLGMSGKRIVVGNDAGKKDLERPVVDRDRQHVQPKMVRNGNFMNGTNRMANADMSIDSSKRARLERSKITEANNPWASHSTTALHHSQNQSARRPLFGEVVDISTSVEQAGFGIDQRPRRGSEGSFRPLIAHRRAKSQIESPLSPTSWYLGADHPPATFRTGNDGSPVIRPPHRRAKSDFARNRPTLEDAPAFEPHSSTSRMGLNGWIDTAEEINCITSPKPPSRIPIPIAVISGAKTGQSPTKFNAEKGSITRGHGAALRSSGKSACTGMARPPAQFSTPSSRYDERHGARYTSSPVLRSSRPVGQVSAASTSASRAKIVGRHGGIEEGRDVTPPGRGDSDVVSMPRNIPQLGVVDFAARRKKIQLALDESVREHVVQRDRQIDSKFKAQSTHEIDGSQNAVGPIAVDTVSTEKESTSGGLFEPPHSSADIESKTEHEVLGTGDADSDRADAESIQIVLESSPITQVKLDADGSHQWDTPVKKKEIDNLVQSAHPPTQEIQHIAQHVEAGISDLDSGSAFAQEGNCAVGSVHGDSTWSPCTLPTPQTGNSTHEGSTYNAINRILEQYHQTDMTSPNTLRELRQRLLTETPELARLGEWDPNHIPQLLLQGLGYAALDSPARTPDWSISENKTDENPRMLEQDHVEMARSVTDIDTNGSDVALGEDRPSCQLSQGGWSSVRQSLEIEESARAMRRASLQSRNDWEDASPSVADWMQPQAERSVNGPTPPPKQPVSPLDFQDLVEGCLQSEEGLLSGREPACTARLSVDGPPQASTVRPAGKGLGLTITTDEPQNVPDPSPPPLPDHAPPPPPVPETNDEDAAPALVLLRRRSPPSPSVYSRNPPSSIFPAAANEEFRIPQNSFRTSDLSTPIQPVFTPSGPQTRSTSSSQSRDANNLEHPFGQATEMTSVPPVPGPEQARLTARRNVIKELLDTEFNYLRDINITVAIYKPSAKNISMQDEDIKVLFGNLDQVATFTQTFFDSLRQAATSVYVAPKNPCNRRTSASTAASSVTEDRLSLSDTDITDDDRDRRTFIGEVFGRYLARMEKVYGDYLKNHDMANKKLEELQQLPAVRLWLQQCHVAAQDMTNAWSLDSLLVKPVQRLLKYPLLLTELLKYTPENHPDYTGLEFALRELKAVSLRINDAKKRAELVEKVLKRKRKESESRSGLSKALGRRTEKLKQHVGLSEAVEDHEYTEIKRRLDYHFTQLFLAIKDFEAYLAATESFVDRFQSLIQSIESYIDISKSGHLEVVSKWRKFRIVARELSTVALAEHKAAVEASVIEPLRTLFHMYQRPQELVDHREKLKIDYARFKTTKARGDKPDKRTQEEEMETFVGINNALKEELPKLYDGTGKLVCECLVNFVELHMIWQATWQVKLRSILDESQITESLPEIVDRWSSDFAITEAQALCLGICNGAFLAETANFLSPPSTRVGDDYSSRRPSIASSRGRAISLNSNSPPQAYPPSDPAFLAYGGGGYPTSDSPLSRSRHHVHPGNQPLRVDRTRAGSTWSTGQGGEGMMPVSSPATRSFSAMTSSSSVNHPHGTVSHRPSTSTTRSVEITIPSPPTPPLTRLGGVIDPHAQTRPTSGSSYLMDINQQALSPTRPFSGFFSSAMPMSENNTPNTASPRTSRPTSPFSARDRPHVLWIAVSTEEFNVDRARSEAGYPFLTYVKSEIFDVVAEKGELWLAQNQDDKTHQIGWIWRKHFVKLS